MADKPLDPVAEAAFKVAIGVAASGAMWELCQTLKPNFDAVGLGYKDVQDAREQIIQAYDKLVNKMSAKHLRDHG